MTAHLLIAEDSPTQAERLRSILLEAGYHPTVTSSGEEALAELQRAEPVDLVLSDIMMPGIDGFELCRRIKGEPQTAALPVLLLTSLRDPLDVVRALEVGADHFIHKPYEPEHLIARVGTALEHRTAAGEAEPRSTLELTFLGRRFRIDARRRQLLELLVSTFEDLVDVNRRLRANEHQLAEAQEDLAAQLRASDLEQRHLATLLDSLPDAVLITDPNGRIADGNRAATALTGSEVRTLVGRRLTDALPLLDRTGAPLGPADNPLGRPAAGQDERQGLRAAVRGGRRVPVSVRTAVVRDERDEAVATIAVVRDTSAETFTDPVTGLPTRQLFLDRLEQAVLQSQRTEEPIALVHVGVERLELVTDTYGIEVAEQVLTEIARRLVGELGRGDTLAELGEGQFGVLRGMAEDAGELLRFADRLVAAVSRPFTVDGASLTLRAGGGVTVEEGQRTSAAALLQQAQTAAHQARAAGQPSRLFDPELQIRVQERLELEADLAQALRRDELVVHYQPEIRLSDLRIIGTEALIRWRHPHRGLLAPGGFVDVAEESGLIVPLGRWVLREACRQTATWNGQLRGPGEDLFVAVNLSARQLDDADLVDDVARALADADLPADALMLEVTETAVIRDPAGAADRLHALKDLGVRLALDDFGTGYSSLAYLSRFPFDVLKVDRSFVRELAHASGRAVVQAIISLGEAFGLMVVAEGVETPQQREQLSRLRCPVAAGYLFERPRAPDALGPTLARGAALTG